MTIFPRGVFWDNLRMLLCFKWWSWRKNSKKSLNWRTHLYLVLFKREVTWGSFLNWTRCFIVMDKSCWITTHQAVAVFCINEKKKISFLKDLDLVHVDTEVSADAMTNETSDSETRDQCVNGLVRPQTLPPIPHNCWSLLPLPLSVSVSIKCRESWSAIFLG